MELFNWPDGESDCPDCCEADIPTKNKSGKSKMDDETFK
jgi:hypothetical protein